VLHILTKHRFQPAGKVETTNSKTRKPKTRERERKRRGSGAPQGPAAGSEAAPNNKGKRQKKSCMNKNYCTPNFFRRNNEQCSRKPS